MKWMNEENDKGHDAPNPHTQPSLSLSFSHLSSWPRHALSLRLTNEVRWESEWRGEERGNEWSEWASGTRMNGGSDGWERVEGKEWMRERSEWKEMTGPLLTVHSPGLIIPFLAGLWVSLRAKGMCVGWRDEPVLIFPFIHRLRNPHTSYSFLTLLFLSFGAWISWVSCHLSRLYLGYWRWHREETQPTGSSKIPFSPVVSEWMKWMNG